MTKIKIGSDFSGVGAFNQALIRLGIAYEEVFACDMDKYARQTFVLNYGEPKYYPKDVYEREIPKESLDIYMTSPPCQSFSMAGKRLGKEDQRGILFFNSLEFIRENKPRYFIFENVKGLLSHDKVDKNQEFGRTFQEWINYLGGKSINGVHTFFPYEDAVPYHIYFQVLNAKHYGIPQNRERIFIIGIRDDEDNNFTFPKPFPLEKRLKDVLETEVDEKYFLSEKTLEYFVKHKEHHQEKGNGFGFKPQEETDTHDNSLTTKYGSRQSDTYLKIQIADYRADEGLRIRQDGNSPCITSSIRHTDEFKPKAGTRNPPLVIFTNEAKIGAIRGRNPENPKSRKSGLETEQMLEINENGTSNALTTVQKDNVVVYYFNNKRLNETLKNNSLPNEVAIIDSYNQTINTEHSHTISTRINASSCSHVFIPTNNSKGFDLAEEEEEDSINFSVPNSKTRRGRVGKKVSQTLDTQCNQGVFTQQRIRRLTPLEAFRLMDFNPEMIDKTIESKLISDSQLYKQAGNSICVGVLVEIIKKLKL